MFFYDVLYLSACNAWRDRARTILTALSICIGVASVILISTLGDSGCAVVTKEVEKLGISGITLYSQKESVELKNSDIKTLSKSFGATSSVQPLIIEIGKYKIKGGEYDALLWGVGDCVDKIIGFELIFGRNFTKSDIAQSKKVAIVDRELAIEKYKRENIVGKEIVLRFENRAERFEIIGVISAQKDGINQMVGGVIPQFIYLPHTTLSFLRGDNSITQIAIECSAESDGHEIGEQAITTLARANKVHKDTYRFENMSEHIGKFTNITSIVALLISAIAGISLIVAGLGIINSTLSATFERRHEIGIMMATGAKRSDIAKVFIIESAIISTVGGVLGAILGVGLSLLITKTLNMPQIISVQNLILIELIALLCGVIFAFVPSYIASRQNPVETLRE